MNTDRFIFGLLYRFGYTPWDGHNLPRPFTEFIEGKDGAPGAAPAEVLDIGCGTGDLSIYLARHKWTVTAVDFVEVALAKARAKTEAVGVNVRYLRGDATKLSAYSLGTFSLVIDGGCMHGFSDDDRDAYVRELEKAVKPGGRFFLFAFDEAKRRRPPRGISRPEIERRLGPQNWDLVSTSVDTSASLDPGSPLHFYNLRRR